MTPEQAANVLLESNPDMQLGKVAVKYKNYYIYDLIPKGEDPNKNYIDNLYSVDSNTGDWDAFNPLDYDDYKFPNIKPLS